MQGYHTNTEDAGSLGYNSVCLITSRIGWVFKEKSVFLFKEKSERILLSIPQSGKKKKKVKTFRWDHMLQIQTSSWHLNRFPDGSKIGSTVVKYRGEAHCYTVHFN